MINKETYRKKLIELLEMYYPDKDYRVMCRAVLISKLGGKMDEYVVKAYGSYCDNNPRAMQAVLNEGHRLLDECLREMGITR
jgi:hypothetical protein